jgi:NAD+ synthase
MFRLDVLTIDAGSEAERISALLRHIVLGDLRRRGVVVGLSGGIDSSVVAALAARALGPERVLGLLLPERDSSADSVRLGGLVAERLGIDVRTESIEALLEACGAYDRQAAAARLVFPEYGPGWRCKIVLPPLDAGRLNVFELVVADPSGHEQRARPTSEALLQLIAATNFKQRLRMSMEYYHAERLRYAVAGTPNFVEYDQGFFVKHGDGAADVKPIAHLYKSQVYRLAEHLEIPAEVLERQPTTDTYPLPQTQEEFYFALPYAQLDLCLWAFDHEVPKDEVASVLGLTEAQVRVVFDDIAAKRRAARYLHHVPVPLWP